LFYSKFNLTNSSLLHLELYIITLRIHDVEELETIECALVVAGDTDSDRKHLANSVKKIIERRAAGREFKILSYVSQRVSLEDELYQ